MLYGLAFNSGALHEFAAFGNSSSRDTSRGRTRNALVALLNVYRSLRDNTVHDRRRQDRRWRATAARSGQGHETDRVVSRDGKRVYFSNALYTPWDNQFYPDGVRGWVAKVDITGQGMQVDSKFFLEVEGMRTHQLRLEGGDASSDSFCYS